MSSDDIDVEEEAEDKKDGCLTLVLLVAFFLVYGFIELLSALPRWSRRIAGKKDL